MQHLQSAYVFAAVGGDPYRDVGVWTAQARRINTKAVPLLQAAQSQSGLYCLIQVLNGGIKDN